MTSSPRVTRPGPNGPVTLSARMWALLEDAYRAAGMDPARFLVVTQGSWSSGVNSGSTHQGGGAADLRVWNLPASVQANLGQALIVPLRQRGGLSSWWRDQAHGGFDPHIHVIVRDEPGLSSGASWQVQEAIAGRNGLSNGGRDYHPRPAWTPFAWPTTPNPPQVITREDGEMIFRTHQDSATDGQGTGRGRHYLILPNGNACLLQTGYVNDGVPAVSSASEQSDRAFFAAIGQHFNGDAPQRSAADA